MSSITARRITDRYNYALDNLKEAINSAKSADIGKEQEHLVSAANAIYEIIEWSFKFILSPKFRADSPTYEQEIREIEGNSFYKKIKLFEIHAIPSPRSIGIDTNLILSQKQEIRNDPEHSGGIPHYNTIIKLLYEAEKIIRTYVDEACNPIILSDIEKSYKDTPILKWDEFFDAADSFEENRNYILITSKLNENNDLVPLSYINWNLIIDLDENTEESGLYKEISSQLSLNNKVHLFTKDDSQTFSPFNAVYWYAAKGLFGRNDSLVANYKDWSKKYNNQTSKIIQNFTKVFGDKPTTVIVLSTVRLVFRICEILFNHLDKSLKFVYALEDSNAIEDVITDYVGDVIPINIGTITKGLSDRSDRFKIKNPINVCLSPAAENGNVVIKQDDYFWFEEDFEFIHLNKLQNYVSTDSDSRHNFLRGNEITWFGLASSNDVERDKFKEMKKLVERNLKDRKVSHFILQHYPGIGGTTLAKRIAWEIHKNYPVVVLRRYSYQETVNKLYSLYEYSKLPVLIIAEAATIRMEDIERLNNEVGSRNFPCTFLTIQRKINGGSKPTDSLVLPGSLSDLEFQVMLNLYKTIAPPKRITLLDDIQTSTEDKYKHPFYMGLMAFEEDFEGLQSFVEKSLLNSTALEKKVMAFLAITHHYAQKPIQAQYFSSIFNWPENSVLNLSQHLNSDLQYLLINDGNNEWRPLHYLISEELLVQILGGTDRRTWNYNLSEYCVELILLNEDSELHNTDLFLDILERLFVFRDNEDLLGKEEDKHFSNVIDDIPTEEGKFRIFKQLTESFPEEPHFWGHLARYYSFKRKDYSSAIYAVDKAISLTEKPNPLLHHMKGMCLRSEVYSLIYKYSTNKETRNAVDLLTIEDLVAKTEKEFEHCRQLNKTHEYGYISHIQLLINIIDFGFRISNSASKNDFLISPSNSHYRDHLDTAEELLSTLKRIKISNSESPLFLECDVKIKELYGDYSKAIQGWTNILTRNDIYKPPIRRQIARAYVRRKSFLENLEPREIQRIVQLMEDNILEEPGEEKNIFLWFNAMRLQQYVDFNRVVEKISHWKINHNTLEKTYYLYVLYAVDAIDKGSISKERAQSLIRECSEMARTLPNRTFCFEWLGNETGIKRILSHKDAISRDANGEIILQKLTLLNGKVTRIKGPEAGEIELESGLTAFFTPARANLGKGLFKDKDINRNVKFKIGFSYDGLRAWEVEIIS